jgi:hypothetical protein
MNLLNKAFPHPILRPDTNDFLDSSFQAVIEPSVVEDEGVQKIEIECEFWLSNERLLSEIQNQTATYAIDISCKDTLFRKIFKLQKSETVVFDDKDLYGRVEISPLVICTHEINDFYSDDLNPEFGDNSFLIKPGDILAFDDQMVAFIEFSKLSFESLIRVQTSSEIEPLSYSVALEGEMITILMGEKFRIMWEELRSDKATGSLLAMSIYKDCVLMALNHIAYIDEADECRWARALMNKLQSLGRVAPNKSQSLDDINLLAQELIASLGVKRVFNDA